MMGLFCCTASSRGCWKTWTMISKHWTYVSSVCTISLITSFLFLCFFSVEGEWDFYNNKHIVLCLEGGTWPSSSCDCSVEAVFPMAKRRGRVQQVSCFAKLRPNTGGNVCGLFGMKRPFCPPGVKCVPDTRSPPVLEKCEENYNQSLILGFKIINKKLINLIKYIKTVLRQVAWTEFERAMKNQTIEKAFENFVFDLLFLCIIPLTSTITLLEKSGHVQSNKNQISLYVQNPRNNSEHPLNWVPFSPVSPSVDHHLHSALINP